ncbi:MAG: ADOP family duplicated permease, partial [Candidatus Rokuibacteriota bacterium]
MDRLLQDLRLAVRRLGKEPGFAALAVLTLALGIGGSTAVFSVVRGVVLAPLPFENPERLSFLTRDGDVSIPDGVDWRASSPSFEQIALLLRSWAFDLTGDGEPERILGAVVEPEYFEVLHMPPLLGRVLTREDNVVGGAHVAVISEGFWKRRFAGEPGVLGRTITLSDHLVTVVGVMPARFDFLQDGVELWVPVAVETPWAMAERGTNNFDAIGRLRPGASFATARAEMVALTTRLAGEYPKTNAHKIVDPLPMLDFMVGAVRPALLVLLAAVGLVVLIASVNLAGFLLARATSRQPEFALRLAVGAGRSRLLGQMVTEGMTLAALGGIVGLVLAFWGSDALRAVAPDSLPRTASIAVDGPVLAFALLATLLTGLVFSLIPAVQVLRADPAAFLSTSGRGLAGGRGQRALGAVVAAEVALACVLLVGSGLLIRTFLRLQGVPLGFDPQNVLTAELVLPEARYGTREPQTRAFRTMVDAVAEQPGVEAAAYVIGAPLAGARSGIGGVLLFADREFPVGSQPGARHRPVYGDYFKALRIPIVEGRALTRDDGESAPLVAVVNQSFAREFWPNASALGKRIAWRDFGPTDGPRWMTIVGVALDVKSRDLVADDTRAVYTPYVQRRVDWQRFGTLVVRSGVLPSALTPSVKKAVWSVDPTLPLERVATLQERRVRSSAQQRFNAIALGLFAGTALL